MKPVPILPRYLVWRPSKDDPKQIRMKLPVPSGGYLVQWFSVSHYAGDIDATADIAVAVLNSKGAAMWPEWPDTTIKHKKKAAGTDIGSLVGLDGVASPVMKKRPYERLQK